MQELVNYRFALSISFVSTSCLIRPCAHFFIYPQRHFSNGARTSGSAECCEEGDESKAGSGKASIPPKRRRAYLSHTIQLQILAATAPTEAFKARMEHAEKEVHHIND